ncbi:MAG TPA: AraC family transcriptional regulator, partial [Planctomycetaceae bacterium]|nr:AraC family transcriptional regulator [Planctomycetaceae bacterium]
VLRWFLSSKIPLFGKNGRVIGIAGAMHDFEKAGAVLRPYHEMQEVIAHILTHYGESLSLSELADMQGLSVSQLVRNFRRVLHATPNQFLLRVRVHAACQLLVSTDASIAKIALDTGFYDQSYFSKQFRRRMGISPHAYRQRYRHAAEVDF